MKSINTYYTDLTGLRSFIQAHSIENSPSLLIQVFTARNDKQFIEELLIHLGIVLPKAIIIGSTTDGEIMDGKVSTDKTVLSFTKFEHTRLKTEVAIHQKDGFFSGQSLARSLIQDDTKLIIAFADGLHTNGEAFLEGIHSVNTDVIVGGGLAADHATFDQTYVFTKESVITQGAVAVALSGRELNVYNDYSFNWRCIGKELTITKAENNRVYTIDDRTAVDTYIHYLGKEMAEGLPAIGIEFPLISSHDGVMVARAVLSKHEDGSLSFAGNLRLGEKVQFGYGDPVEILKYSNTMLNNVKNKPSETIFIYSCMARRHFMPDLIERETLPFQNVAPTAGFFTYGEFFTSRKKELLNQSMTILSLSESDSVSMQNPELILSEPQVSSTPINALIHLVNMTSHEAMEQEALQQAQVRFETLFEKSPDGIVLIEYGSFTQCNQKMLDMFAYDSEKDFLTASPLQVFPKRQPDASHSFRHLKEMKERATREGSCQFEFVFKKATGVTFWTDVMLTRMEVNGQDIFYVVCRDISRKKEMEIELSRQKNILYYQANHDDLTGLANRTLFMKELEKGLSESAKSEKELAIFFIDLDRFKKINDSLGHDVGDKMIHIVGERLKRNIRKGDIVARLGGDEFLLMMRNVEQYEDILAEAGRILKILDDPIAIAEHTLYSTASIGISRYPVDDLSASNLLKYADTAMYKAKEEGGNNFQFYASEMTDIAYEDVMIERDLREGIKNKDFEVYYQPQIDLRSEQIVGVEALVRWQHPVVGILSPDIFLPLAEKTGLINELDLWVMQTAMHEISVWYAEGLNPGVLALNVGMTQLEYPSFIDEIKKNFKMYDLDPKWLEVEIIENEVMKNPEKVIGILEALHLLGISIAIDDFGTGYSSLSHLKRLPIDTLKIDKSFITDIPNNEDAIVIVNTMIALAESLRLKVIAEGVETKAQKDFLLSHGCHNVQGYYYSKALSSKEMRAVLLAQSKELLG
ncbi:MAG: hypothetical protein COB07_02910 [Sulfurovum sp.]|nr:MAG: hypothetical protein COB07_02910 [Sulfurovum sp.]